MKQSVKPINTESRSCITWHLDDDFSSSLMNLSARLLPRLFLLLLLLLLFLSALPLYSSTMSYANQIIHFVNETDHCYPCRSPCDTYCIFIYSPPPPSPPPPSLSSPHHQNLSLLFFIIIAILSLLFLIVSYYTIFSKYCFIRNRSPTRPQTQIQQTHEQFLDENHPSVVDHPIWFIKTVGLDQSTINSITVITYKKQDRLVEGTDCSVCLSEFEEDEELRLLPKCSHAFHLPCIDTWLGSHKNCPMCRAPIVSVINPVVDSTTAASGEENLVDGGVVGSDDHRGESVEERELMDGLTQLNTGNESSSLPDKEYALQVFVEMPERDGLQPVRRSVSMSYPILSHSILVPLEGELSSPTAQLVGAKNPRQLASSSSSGRLLQKGAVSMKRSFSSSAKFFSARSSRRQGSVLPL